MEQCHGYKFLIVPTVTKSHVFSLTKIGEELMRRGHQVHILISVNYPQPSDRMFELTSSLHVERYGFSKGGEDSLDYDAKMEGFTRAMLDKKTEMKEMLPKLMKMIANETILLLNDNDELIDRLVKEKFDMAIVDSIFFMKYYYMIPLRLGIPWVTYTDFMPAWITRVPYLPSFVPSRVTQYTDRLTFKERFINTIVNIAFPIYLGVSEPSEEVVKNYRKYGNFSTMDDLISQSLLFITTTDHILDYAHPTMPNIIHAAGLTVKPSDGKSLPDDIKNFMAGAKEGVILATFGSMASSIPPQIAYKFIATFQRLGPAYRIIWRLNNKDNLTIPENVLISRWLPQNDILTDPRVKLFITHSGNNGQHEAVYHGVPMIGFPLLGDQPYNAKRLEYKGFGIAMDIHGFTTEDLYKNIRTILTDQSYKDRVQHASDIFKSAKETPAERAAYWVEHVTKFGGEHLRSAGNDLNIYQYLLLDVLFVISIIVTSFVVCVWKIIRFVVRKCCYMQKKKSTKSKHQ